MVALPRRTLRKPTRDQVTDDTCYTGILKKDTVPFSESLTVLG